MSGLLYKVISVISRFVNERDLERLVQKLIERWTAKAQPDEALRFLFRLDALLYSIQGPLAVKYGGGVHTKHRHTGYHDFFVERIAPGERILDIGCGLGAVAFDLATRAGAVVDGVDLSVGNIAEAKRRFSHPNLNFYVQDALTIESKKEYDVVLLSNVLEHLHERPSVLRKLQKLTGAKRLFVRVPTFERDWRVPLKKELGVEWRLDLDHKTEYTLDEFYKDVAEAGLAVKHLEVRWGEIWSELAAT